MSRRWVLSLVLGFSLLGLVAGYWLHVRWGLEADPIVEAPGDSAAVAKILSDDFSAHETHRPKKRPPGRVENPVVPDTLGELAHEALATVPRESDIVAKHKGDLHFAPPEILDSTEEFARVWDAVKKNPRLAPEAASFYRECALLRDAPLAIRAVCLRHLKDLKTQPGVVLREEEYPELVRRVSDKLTPETL